MVRIRQYDEPSVAGRVGYLLKDRVSQVGEFLDALERVGAGAASAGKRQPMPPSVQPVSSLRLRPAYATGWGDYLTTDFADVMGRAPRSFAQFAHDHLQPTR